MILHETARQQTTSAASAWDNFAQGFVSLRLTSLYTCDQGKVTVQQPTSLSHAQPLPALMMTNREQSVERVVMQTHQPIGHLNKGSF
jgi:hypothetical protein